MMRPTGSLQHPKIDRCMLLQAVPWAFSGWE